MLNHNALTPVQNARSANFLLPAVFDDNKKYNQVRILLKRRTAVQKRYRIEFLSMQAPFIDQSHVKDNDTSTNHLYLKFRIMCVQIKCAVVHTFFRRERVGGDTNTGG